MLFPSPLVTALTCTTTVQLDHWIAVNMQMLNVKRSQTANSQGGPQDSSPAKSLHTTEG